MFNDDEELADGIDLYSEPFKGEIFEQFGNVIFPTKNYNLRIENKDTKVSVFFEKRYIEKNVIVYLDDKRMNFVHNYVFVYSFKGLEGDGATVAQSLLDPAKAKLFDTYLEAEKAFNSLHNKLSKLSNHKLIYYGARNEG